MGPQEAHALCLQPGVWKLKDFRQVCWSPRPLHMCGLGMVLFQHQSCVQRLPPSKDEPLTGCLTGNLWKINGAPNAHVAYWGRSASSTSLLPLHLSQKVSYCPPQRSQAWGLFIC